MRNYRCLNEKLAGPISRQELEKEEIKARRETRESVPASFGRKDSLSLASALRLTADY